MIPPPSDSGSTLVFGTRGSALAIRQTNLAKVRLISAFPNLSVALAIISTEGDRDKQSPLTDIGGRGVFTNALEAAVLHERVDAAVHSAKDLPTLLHPDAPIVAMPDRADPRDVLVSRHGVALGELPPNPRIGTSSRRRAVQIKRLRPDARIVDLRGNIDTRLRKAASPDLDGIVLAAAGLLRMGWNDRIVQTFSPEELMPSPAQGALAIQARRDSFAASMLARIDDPDVSGPVSIERAFLATVGAGCTWPVGAYVAVDGGRFRLSAMLADETGTRIAHACEILTVGEELTHAADVARRLCAEVRLDRLQFPHRVGRRIDRELSGARVVVTRPRRQAESWVAALRSRGAMPLLLPTIRIAPIADTMALDSALREAGQGAFNWLAFTSANAVDICLERMRVLGLGSRLHAGLRVAAVGGATAAALKAAGSSTLLMPEVQTAEGLAAALIRAASSHDRVLYPRSAIGREGLPDALRRAGMDVVSIAAYTTIPESELDWEICDQVRRNDVDVITFGSPSSVRGLVGLVNGATIGPFQVPAVCTGPATEEAARDAGFENIVTADGPGVDAMVEAVTRVWRSKMAGAVAPIRARTVEAGTNGRSGD